MGMYSYTFDIQHTQHDRGDKQLISYKSIRSKLLVQFNWSAVDISIHTTPDFQFL